LKEGMVPAAEAAIEAGAVTPRTTSSPDEVIQHGLKEGMVPAAEAAIEAGAVTPRTTSSPDEVIQHGLKEGMVPATEAAIEAGAVASAASQYFRINLDEASEAYKIAD
ncbi:MAG: hypothetical protein WA996_13980, partial [Candidatus Promineifilaceae bacterium]